MYRAKKDGIVAYAMELSAPPTSRLTRDQQVRYCWVGSTRGNTRRAIDEEPTRRGVKRRGGYWPHDVLVRSIRQEGATGLTRPARTLYILSYMPRGSSEDSNAILCLRSSLLEQIVGNSPRVTSFIREQLRAGHIEDLPPVVPRRRVLLAVRLH